MRRSRLPAAGGFWSMNRAVNGISLQSDLGFGVGGTPFVDGVLTHWAANYGVFCTIVAFSVCTEGASGVTDFGAGL